ncbi:MAG: hypothetical protein HYT48_03185 [Candidatus Vogelbacteria bacterium]|nr:hypothetical protein [Candidatus Vogelbacteria bacterium]
MKKALLTIIVLAIILAALLWLFPISPKVVPAPIPTATSTNSVTPALLPRKPWVSPALTQAEQVLAGLILNSNGFTNGKQENYPDGKGDIFVFIDSFVFGDLNNDGKDEAVGTVHYCSGSCARGLHLYTLENNQVVERPVPGTSSAGATSNAVPQIKNGILTVTLTTNDVTRTVQYRLVNGSLVEI